MDIAVLIRERLNALGATRLTDAELVDELVDDLTTASTIAGVRASARTRRARPSWRSWTIRPS